MIKPYKFRILVRKSFVAIVAKTLREEKEQLVSNYEHIMRRIARSGTIKIGKIIENPCSIDICIYAPLDHIIILNAFSDALSEASLFDSRGKDLLEEVSIPYWEGPRETSTH